MLKFKASVVSSGSMLARHWKIAALSAGYVIFYSSVSVFLYQNLFYDDFDLAVHAQTLWNMAHGSSFSSILGVHFLANHLIPAFYALKVLYQFFQTPLTLLFLQSLALGSGVFLSYKVASKHLSGRLPYFIALAYFFHPSIGYANLFEFHPTTLAVPFLFLMLLSYIEENFLSFLLWGVVSMSFQENILAMVFFLGLTAFFEKRKIYWGFSPMLLAASWFVVGIIKVQPQLNQGKIEFWRIYSQFGDNPSEILNTFFFKPWVLIGNLFSLKTVLYCVVVFAPLLFLPIVGWRFCLPLVPIFFQHLLSARETERMLSYHYTVEMVPFMIAALSMGTREILNRFKFAWVHYALMFAFVVCFVETAILANPYFKSLDTVEAFSRSQKLTFERNLLSQIPKDASVVATLRFLSPLSQRREIYSFHHVYMGTYTLSSKKYNLPGSVEFALLDLNDDFTFSFKKEGSQENLHNFFYSLPWQVVDFSDDTVLFQKSSKNDLSALFQVDPENTLKPDIPLHALLNDEIELEGVSMQLGEGKHFFHIRLSFYWKAMKKPSDDYRMILTLVDRRGKTVYEHARDICYRLRPLSSWSEGERVIEHYWFTVPSKLPAESLELRLGASDSKKEHLLDFKSDQKNIIDSAGRVKIDTFEPASADQYQKTETSLSS